MEMSRVRGIAKRIVEAHGPKAEVEAAQKLQDAEEARDQESVELWRRVRSVLKEMKPPHAS